MQREELSSSESEARNRSEDDESSYAWGLRKSLRFEKSSKMITTIHSKEKSLV